MELWVWFCWFSYKLVHILENPIFLSCLFTVHELWAQQVEHMPHVPCPWEESGYPRLFWEETETLRRCLVTSEKRPRTLEKQFDAEGESCPHHRRLSSASTPFAVSRVVSLSTHFKAKIPNEYI